MVLGAIQPLSILGAALMLGLISAGMLGRRAMPWAALSGLLGLLPFGGLGPLSALLLMLLGVVTTRLTVAVYRRLPRPGSPANAR